MILKTLPCVLNNFFVNYSFFYQKSKVKWKWPNLGLYASWTDDYQIPNFFNKLLILEWIKHQTKVRWVNEIWLSKPLIWHISVDLTDLHFQYVQSQSNWTLKLMSFSINLVQTKTQTNTFHFLLSKFFSKPPIEAILHGFGSNQIEYRKGESMTKKLENFITNPLFLL